MTIDSRIGAFVKLGKFFKQFGAGASKENNELNAVFYDDFQTLITTVGIHNPWFVEANVRNAITAFADNLQEDKLVEWVSVYINDLKSQKQAKTVAVIMAGNVPMVGFHDMLCVLISGNKFVGKLSSDDKFLLPFIGKILIAIEPEFANQIVFTENQLQQMDAVIATGSNNSARYFEHYFGKYPNIIRKNRNSVAVIKGDESKEQLAELGKDIFQYFGLGCRNVSKLFVPKGYKFDLFYEAIFDYSEVVNHNKYANNYDYNKTVYLMSNESSLLDNNFLLLKEDERMASPIGVLFYEFYNDIQSLNKRLAEEQEQIQCIVASDKQVNNSIPFGTAQCPQLNDYADGVDTMKFLLTL